MQCQPSWQIANHATESKQAKQTHCCTFIEAIAYIHIVAKNLLNYVIVLWRIQEKSMRERANKLLSPKSKTCLNIFLTKFGSFSDVYFMNKKRTTF